MYEYDTSIYIYIFIRCTHLYGILIRQLVYMFYTTVQLIRLQCTHCSFYKLRLISLLFPPCFPLIFPLFPSYFPSISPLIPLCPYLGPMGTPYQNGCFEFDVFLPADYPNTPPKVGQWVRIMTFLSICIVSYRVYVIR